MFKKLAADALGLSDIGRIISPKDYDKVDADDYIFHEDGEKIFFLIKSKSDEYCFTNRALIHVDGASAISKKRLLKRYEYFKNPITEVTLETAGTIDLDVEIKFKIGTIPFSIDVDKQQLEQLKDLYKALYQISLITYENNIGLTYTNEGLKSAVSVMSAVRIDSKEPLEFFKEIANFSYEWLVNHRNNYVIEDFGHIFSKYIEN